MRYVVTLSAYVWADDDETAKAQGEEYARMLNEQNDCRASVDALCEQPFGKLINRPIIP